MRLEQLRLAAVLSWYYHGYSLVAAQSGTTETTSTMTDPADRTYPITITNSYSMTRTAASAVVTVDHVTVIDPWPISPDPESIPFTVFQTQITQRTISSTPAAATPSATSLTSTATWIVWPIQQLDMSPDDPPVCPGPNGCAYRTIKPNYRCLDSGRETRCAAQCLLKDWMWWCTRHAGGPSEALMGRVCAASNGTTAWEEILEPCDHTDMKPGCPLCPETPENEGTG